VDTTVTPEIRYTNRTDPSCSPGDVAGRQCLVLIKRCFTAKTPFLLPSPWTSP